MIFKWQKTQQNSSKLLIYFNLSYIWYVFLYYLNVDIDFEGHPQKSSAVTPPKVPHGSRRPIRTHQRQDINFHFPRRTALWRGQTIKICVRTSIKVQTPDSSHSQIYHVHWVISRDWTHFCIQNPQEALGKTECQQDDTLIWTTPSRAAVWPCGRRSPLAAFSPARWPSRVSGALTTQLYVIRPHREPANGTKGIIEEEKTRGEMSAESPSPPLSRTENAALPLCSELLSPRPSAILERAKSSCFLSPSLTTWHSFDKASAAVFQQQRRHILQIAPGTSCICRAKYLRHEKKKKIF